MEFQAPRSLLHAPCYSRRNGGLARDRASFNLSEGPAQIPQKTRFCAEVVWLPGLAISDFLYSIPLAGLILENLTGLQDMFWIDGIEWGSDGRTGKEPGARSWPRRGVKRAREKMEPPRAPSFFAADGADARECGSDVRWECRRLEAGAVFNDY